MDKLNKAITKLEKITKENEIQKDTWNDSNENIVIEIYDVNNNKVELDVSFEKQREGKFNIKIDHTNVKPGLYKIKTILNVDGMQFITESEFAWGVLTINTDKSIFLPNEEAFIAMAVLDDGGNIVCDADVTLNIKDPFGAVTTLSTLNGAITISDECEFLGVTNLPDYYTTYTVGEIGNYSLDLTAITENGIKTIYDNIIVQSSVPFDVTRDGPTRIYPLVPYTMSFTINANENYSGKINEYVPASFAITPQNGLTIKTIGNTKELSWTVNIKQDETVNLSYEFDAPDVSPELFLLGPLSIGTFSETRQWQIASDAISFTGGQSCSNVADPGLVQEQQ